MKLFIFENIEICKHKISFHSGYNWISLVLIVIQALLLFSATESHAQDEKTYSTFINPMYTSGHISVHSKDISHAARGFTHGFDITSRNLLPLKSKLNDRQKLVYLDIGFHYSNYPMSYLGESFALTF